MVADRRPRQLVAIADTLRDGLDELLARSRMAVDGGATVVHLRLKGEDARTLLGAARALIAALPVPVVVHDRVDVGVAAGAAGVHLSPDEIPASVARGLLLPSMTLGASLGSVADAPIARGADYVSIGPVYPSGRRAMDDETIGLAEFARLARLADVPAIAVGGISPDNVAAVLEAGAVGVAVIMGSYGKARAVQAIRELRAAIET